jgi:diaminohydroxyphosphoribosylaminopyrimidine deaminase/5-amino-6-(5-phosphoribosylamino)uracil reductase
MTECPEVTLKLATSLDGRIATASGQSRWITGSAARRIVHEMRASHDAVLVGSRTVLADDPELTARLDPPARRQPLRILADSQARTPPGARVFADLDRAPLAIAVREGVDWIGRGWPFHPEFSVWVLPPDPSGRHLCLASLLARAAEAGCRTLLCEGGGELAAALVRENRVDRLEWFRSPILLGGDGRPCLGALGLGAIRDAPSFERERFDIVGADIWESYRKEVACSPGL